MRLSSRARRGLAWRLLVAIVLAFVASLVLLPGGQGATWWEETRAYVAILLWLVIILLAGWRDGG